MWTCLRKLDQSEARDSALDKKFNFSPIRNVHKYLIKIHCKFSLNSIEKFIQEEKAFFNIKTNLLKLTLFTLSAG